jgi:hypothetical protein
MTKIKLLSEVTQSSQSYPSDTLQGNTTIRNKRVVKNINRVCTVKQIYYCTYVTVGLHPTFTIFYIIKTSLPVTGRILVLGNLSDLLYKS